MSYSSPQITQISQIRQASQTSRAGPLSVPKILALLIPEILAHLAIAKIAGRDKNRAS